MSDEMNDGPPLLTNKVKKFKKAKRPKIDQEVVNATPGSTTKLARPPKQDPNAAFDPVKVDPKTAKHVALPPTTRYWVGAFTDAPFDVKHFGGVAFPKYTGVVESDPRDGRLILDRAECGAIADIPESQVEAVKASVARSVIRTVGNREDATGNYRCDRYDVSVPGYRPSGADTPAGKFLYMIKLSERMPLDWRKQRPPSMI